MRVGVRVGVEVGVGVGVAGGCARPCGESPVRGQAGADVVLSAHPSGLLKKLVMRLRLRLRGAGAVEHGMGDTPASGNLNSGSAGLNSESGERRA